MKLAKVKQVLSDCENKLNDQKLQKIEFYESRASEIEMKIKQLEIERMKNEKYEEKIKNLYTEINKSNFICKII